MAKTKWVNRRGRYVQIDEFGRILDPNHINNKPTIIPDSIGKKPEIQPPPPPVDLTPKLSPWQGIDFNDPNNVYQASTVTGDQISQEMQKSPWFKMALDKQRAEEAMNLNRGIQQQQSGLAQARGALSMRGGMRAGARERLAMAGQESLLSNAQGIRGAGAIERGDIGMRSADIAARTAQFNATQQQQAQNANVQARRDEEMAKRAYDMQRYMEEMKAYAAAQTAEGIRKSGGGGGFFADPLGTISATFNKPKINKPFG